MDPLVMIGVPGFLGGLVIALILVRAHRRPQSSAVGPIDRQPLSTDVINMARIRVAGIGGLGLVAMAVLVAAYIPRIRQSVTIGLLLGAAFAIALILRRSRTGPMPSSGRHAGANATLSIEDSATSTDRDDSGVTGRTVFASR